MRVSSTDKSSKHRQAADKYGAWLQRLQKQQLHSSSSSVVNPAAASQGRLLAQQFGSLFLRSHEEATSITDKSLHSYLSQTWEWLAHPTRANPALVTSFFETLQTTTPHSSAIPSDLWVRWLLQAEDEESLMCSQNARLALIRTLGYHQWYSSSSNTGNNHADSRAVLTDLFRRCVPSTRRLLIREWTRIAFSPSSTPTITMATRISFLQPFLVAALFTTTTKNIVDVSHWMESLWRQSSSSLWKVVESSDEALPWLAWWLKLLDWYIISRVSASMTSDEREVVQDMISSWINYLLEMAQDYFQYQTETKFYGQQEQEKELQQADDPSMNAALLASDPFQKQLQDFWIPWLSKITASILPRLFALSTNSEGGSLGSLQEHWSLLNDILQQIIMLTHENPTGNTLLAGLWNYVDCFQVLTVALSTPHSKDVQGILNIGFIALQKKASNGDLTLTPHSWMAAWLTSLASVHARTPGCERICQDIQNWMAQQSSTSFISLRDRPTINRRKNGRCRRPSMPHFIQFFVTDDNNNNSSLVQQDELTRFLFAAKTNWFAYENQNMKPLSSYQQTACLMVGVYLLRNISVHCHEDLRHRQQKLARLFLGNLLQVYPHLGITLLPIVIDDIQKAAFKGYASQMMFLLEFVCDHMVYDPQCASEVWNLLGIQFMDPDKTPSIMRASIIRFFPRLCQANKRLCKRVMEALRNQLAFANKTSPALPCIKVEQIRLAVAATIADLTREDQIRDVSEVVGWIQGFITEISWIHSVSTLDQEKSASKATQVYYAILALHYLVVAQELDFNLVMVVLNKRLCNIHDIQEVSKLPPLVLEALALLLGDGECGEEDSEEGNKAVGVSKQVADSVSTLIALSLSPKLRLGGDQNITLRNTLMRCHGNIFHSLSQYSVDALGIDDEGLKAIVASFNQEEVAALPPSGYRYESLRKVVADGIQMLEQSNTNSAADPDSMGSIQTSLPKLISKMLLFEEQTLGSSLWQKRGNRKTTSAANTTDKQILKTRKDENSISWDELKSLPFPSDPYTLVLAAQVWLSGSRAALGKILESDSVAEELNSLLESVREWNFEMDSPDAMYLALSAIAVMIPETLVHYDNDGKLVQEISQEVWDGHMDDEFENDDVRWLCIGLIGMAAMYGDDMIVDDIVDALECNITGYGGRFCPGAHFGLAIIAQACHNILAKNGHDSRREQSMKETISRIVALLINGLAECTGGAQMQEITDLVSAIRSGKATSKLAATIAELDSSSILEVEHSRDEVSRSLFIAISVCASSLSVLDHDLLLGVYYFLDTLPWSSGKGIAVASVVQECRNCGKLKRKELESILAKHATLLEAGIENCDRGLDDLLFYVAASSSKKMPDSIRRFLVGNGTLLDERGQTISLLAMAASICSIPCLGHRALSVTEPPSLSPNATAEDIDAFEAAVNDVIKTNEPSKYSQYTTCLRRFIATAQTAANGHGHLRSGNPAQKRMTETINSTNPVAQQGSVLEVVMTLLSDAVQSPEIQLPLLGCIGVLALPGHFAGFFELLFSESDGMKKACTKLLVSQTTGRPRAVFDGKEYIDLATKITKMQLRGLNPSILGSGDAQTIFVDGLVDLIPRFSTDTAIIAVEGSWKASSCQLGSLPCLAVAFLNMARAVIRASGAKRAPTISPKALDFLRNFLAVQVFVDLQRSPMELITTSSAEEVSVLDAYIDVLTEVPLSMLDEWGFFKVNDSAGFTSEALRKQCILSLVSKGYISDLARSFHEISTTLAWIFRQAKLMNEKDMSDVPLLQVASALAGATAAIETERKKKLLLALLDNLLLADGDTAHIGLSLLGVLVYFWNCGKGADGETSLVTLIYSQLHRWNELATHTLRQVFRLVLNDMPFNLAEFARSEKMPAVVLNRLLRIGMKWAREPAGTPSQTEILKYLRRAIVACGGSFADDSSDESYFDAIHTLLL